MSFVIATLVAVTVGATIAAGRRARVRQVASERGAPMPGPQRRQRYFKIANARRNDDVIRPAAVAAWADDLARALRHGSTLHAALTHTPPGDVAVERRAAPLRHWLGRGATVAEACDEWSVELTDDALIRAGRRRRNHHRCELLSTMSAVLAAIAVLGGGAAAPLDRFAITMRQRASDDLERMAQSAQAKMSARVLTAVPLAVLALLLLTDADVRGVIASPAGGSVVAIGLVLNMLGALWMRRIASGRIGGTPC